MAACSTYVRKIGEGQFEYGFVVRAKNFRKQKDKYSPAGVCNSVADAERLRELLLGTEQ